MARTKNDEMSIAELRARVELAHRAIDDVVALMRDADPAGDPQDYAERERKALATLDEINSLVPLGKPLSPEERESMRRKIGAGPDRDESAKVFALVRRVLNDPTTPDDLRRKLEESGVTEGMRSLDWLEAVEPLQKKANAAVAALVDPKKRTPRKS